MDGDENDARDDHEIDWLEQSPDLPHLIARVSELVLRHGYAPEDLLTLPRGELDRRELAAYSAGWADVVSEQLPAIRRAYEERITAAYFQGQDDALTGHRPRRARRTEGVPGGEVIPLPYVELLRPPSEMARVEARGERERSVADGTPVPSPGPGADEPDGDAGDFLPSAREAREKRSARSARRAVVRRNGRASVPPLTRSGGDAGAGRDRGRRTEPGERPQQEPPPEERPRLSDRARALADGLEGRATGRRRDEPPEVPGSGSGPGAGSGSGRG
ncbi:MULTISPECIES: hypothetical protein [Streptomyces]|uniref:Uncharacterized protein n=2 Tax=Streptomyces TaxID=1883 RepID=A0ABV9IWF9_9ACTN